MTPFHPTALLAMLLTFYPLVNVAELQRARRERPDYFAGGTLFGSTGEKLRLPDGRVFDLIFDASNVDPARRRWQVILPGPGTADDAAFPLEAGPFTPIDADAWPAPHAAPVFVPLVAAAYASLGDADGLFGTAASSLTAASAPAALTTVFESTIGAAERKISSSQSALTAADPTDVILAAGGVVPVLNAHEGEFSEPAPPEFPGVRPPVGPPVDDVPVWPDPNEPPPIPPPPDAPLPPPPEVPPLPPAPAPAPAPVPPPPPFEPSALDVSRFLSAERVSGRLGSWIGVSDAQAWGSKPFPTTFSGLEAAFGRGEIDRVRSHLRTRGF